MFQLVKFDNILQHCSTAVPRVKKERGLSSASKGSLQDVNNKDS